MYIKKILLFIYIFPILANSEENILLQIKREVIQEKRGDFNFIPWSNLLKNDESAKIFDRFSEKDGSVDIFDIFSENKNPQLNLPYLEPYKQHFEVHDSGYNEPLKIDQSDYKFINSQNVVHKCTHEKSEDIKNILSLVENGSVDINYVLDAVAIAQNEAKKFSVERKMTEQVGYKDYLKAKKLIIENTISIINENKHIDINTLDITKDFIEKSFLPDVLNTPLLPIYNDYKKPKILSFDKNNPGIFNIEVKRVEQPSRIRQRLIERQAYTAHKSAITLALMRQNPEYSNYINNKFNIILDTLLKCNSEDTETRILARLSTPNLEMEYPYGYHLENTLFMMRKKYFDKNGKLKNTGHDHKLGKRLDPFIKNSLKRDKYSEILHQIGSKAGGTELLNWQNSCLVEKFFIAAPQFPTKAVKRIIKIFTGLGNVEPRAIINNIYNKKLEAFIYKCQDWNFDNLEDYYRYDIDNTMKSIYRKNHKEFIIKNSDLYGVYKQYAEDPYWKNLPEENKKERVKKLGCVKVNKILAQRELDRSEVKKEFNLPNNKEIEGFLYKLNDIVLLPIRTNFILENAVKDKKIAEAFLDSNGILKNANKDLVKNKTLPRNDLKKMGGINHFLSLYTSSNDQLTKDICEKGVSYLLKDDEKYLEIASKMFHSLINCENHPILHSQSFLPNNYNEEQLDAHKRILNNLDLENPTNVELSSKAMEELSNGNVQRVNELINKDIINSLEKYIDNIDIDFTEKVNVLGQLKEDFLDIHDSFEEDEHEELFLERAQSISNAIDNNFEKVHVEYMPKENSEKIILEFDLNSENYRSFVGNLIQHQIHKESLDILEGAGSVRYPNIDNQPINNLTATAVNLVDLAEAHSKVGKIEKSFSLLDSALTILDYVFIAPIEGVELGALNTVDFFIHPVQSAKGMWQGIKFVATSIFDEIQEQMTIQEAYSYDRELGIRIEKKSQEEFDRKLDAFWKIAKQIPPRDLIKYGIAMLVETYLTGKAFNGIGKIISKAPAGATIIKNALPEKAALLADKARQICQEEIIVTTAFGSFAVDAKELAQITGRSAKSLSNLLNKPLKRANLSLLTENNVARLAKMYSVGSLQRATQRLTPFMDLIRSKKKYLKALRSFMNLEQELIALESICQSGIKSIKHLGLGFDKIDLWHVFSPEMYKSGNIGGYHHIMKGPMRKIVKNIQRIKGTSIYTGELKYAKGLPKLKTLFPPEWSRAEILEKLFEACRNYPTKGKIIPSAMQNQKIIESLTNDGMKIKMVIKNGSLRSFYPVLA